MNNKTQKEFQNAINEQTELRQVEKLAGNLVKQEEKDRQETTKKVQRHHNTKGLRQFRIERGDKDNGARDGQT